MTEHGGYGGRPDFTPMTSYRLEGGPFDGETVATDGTSMLRVPKPQDTTAWATGRSEGRRLTIDYEEYRLVAGVYRWTGMVDDAYAEVNVTAEAWPDVHRFVRSEARRRLALIAEGKALDRLIWRIGTSPYDGMFKVTALVGPRRLERAAWMREQRRMGFPTA